jgi:hypothetical protein
MKKYLFCFLFFIFSFIVYSQDIQIKVTEKLGKVDLKSEGKWNSVSIGQLLSEEMEIYTGFHSKLTFEVGNGSYITINQLSHCIIGKQKIDEKSAITEVTLQSGFIVAYTKKIASYKNQLVVNTFGGSAVLENAGGEIYARTEQGSIIKSFFGTINIKPKVKNLYFIIKNEICGLTTSGLLIENDYFLRRNINIKPNNLNNQSLIDEYYNFIFANYSKEYESNDYKDSRKP